MISDLNGYIDASLTTDFISLAEYPINENYKYLVISLRLVESPYHSTYRKPTLTITLEFKFYWVHQASQLIF